MPGGGGQSHAQCQRFTCVAGHCVQEDMTLEQGKELIQTCINEVATRFLINQPKWKVSIVTAEGVTEEVTQPTVDLTDKIPEGGQEAVAASAAASAAAASGAAQG